MKRTKTTTEINNEQSLKLTSVAGLQDLSESESQAIQGEEGIRKTQCTNNIKQIGLAL